MDVSDPSDVSQISGLLRQYMCPLVFALGATTLASMPHQVQWFFRFRWGKDVSIQERRGGKVDENRM